MTHEPHATSPEHGPEHKIQSIEPDLVVYPVTVFHQGYGNGGGLWYNANVNFSTPLAGAWQGDTSVPSAACLGSPSAVFFQNKLLVFSTGGTAWEFNQLCLNAYDYVTNKWSYQAWWLGVIASPSAVVFNNMVYILFSKQLGNDPAPTLHYATYDGTNLAGPFEVVSRPRALMQNSPGAFVWGDTLYVFFRFFETLGRYQLYFQRFNGLNWDSLASPVPGVLDMAGSPACAAATIGPGTTGLFVFYQGTNFALNYKVLKNTSWFEESTVPNTGITGTPCPADMWDKLYVFHQGDNENGELWYNTMTPHGSWEGDRRVPNTGMSASPSALIATPPARPR